MEKKGEKKVKTLIDFINEERLQKAKSFNVVENDQTFDTDQISPEPTNDASIIESPCQREVEHKTKKSTRRFNIYRVANSNAPNNEKDDIEARISEIFGEDEYKKLLGKTENKSDAFFPHGGKFQRSPVSIRMVKSSAGNSNFPRFSEWYSKQMNTTRPNSCSRSVNDGISSPSQIQVEDQAKNRYPKSVNTLKGKHDTIGSTSPVFDQHGMSSNSTSSLTIQEDNDETSSFVNQCKAMLDEEQEAVDDFLATIKSWRKSRLVKYNISGRSFGEKAALQRWLRSKGFKDDL